MPGAPNPHWIKTSAAGTLSVLPSGAVGQPVIIDVTSIDGAMDASGIPQKQVTIDFTPPSPLHGFQGSWVYVDAPDTAGALHIADGTIAADGTVPSNGIFSPVMVKFAPFIDGVSQIVFTFLAPANFPQFWRVYLCAGTPSFQQLPVQFGLPGASPSFQFYVPLPADTSTGRESAPLVVNARLADTLPAGWDANPHIVTKDSGDQFFEYAIQWDWPLLDQNLQALGGVNLDLSDGTNTTYIGNAGVTDHANPIFISQHLPVPSGTVNYKFLLTSYSVGGVNNSTVLGITPEVDFSVTRKTGAAGIEYAAKVLTDGVHDFVTAVPVNGADGTSLLRVTGYWNNPADPQFFGAEIVVDKADGNGAIWSVQSGRNSPIQNDISQPAAVATWTFYLRSIDVTGKRNTIVPGTTPSIAISVGNANGQLNLAKAAGANFSGEFQIVGTVFSIGTLNASVVKTGQLQVGGGGGKVSQIKIFDTLGSLIGWAGDDTSVSGFVGGWFKQFRVGGSSPSSAQFVADSSGNVSMSGSLIVGAVGSANAVPATGVTAGTFGGGVIYAGTINCSQLNAGTIAASVTLTSPTIQVTSGHIVINLDGTNFLKISDTTFALTYTQMDNQTFTLASTANPSGMFLTLSSIRRFNSSGSEVWSISGTNAGTGNIAFDSTVVLSTTRVGFPTSAWTPYTPTITNLSSTTIDAAYLQVPGSKTVIVRLHVNGTSNGGNPIFTLPFTPASTGQTFASFISLSGAVTASVAWINGSNNVVMNLPGGVALTNTFVYDFVFEGTYQTT